MRRLRAGVAGAGHMGRFHARKLDELARAGAGVTLAAVADPDLERARAAAAGPGAKALAHHRDLADACDLAVVAVPTVHHFEVVRDLLEAGLDVLVEKPIAAGLEEAEALLALAETRRRILQVGHLERFNTAVRAIQARIRRPRFIEVHRMGPFPARATDIDVVRDLMIHDLDLVQTLVGEEPARVEAVGVPVVTDRVDIANARLTFPSGCVANLTASRVSPNPLRKLRIFQANAYFSLDLLARTATLMARVAGPDGAPRIDAEKLELSAEDALRAELEAFLASARDRSPPEVSGEEALRALRTAMRVVDAMPRFEELE